MGGKGGGSGGGKGGGNGGGSSKSGGAGGAKSFGGGGGKSGGGSKMMVAPGTGGSAHIARARFESNPRGYFSNLHGKGGGSGGEKGGGNGGGGAGGAQSGGGGGGGKSGGGSKMMVAPGTGGSAHIARDGFESNPKGYFSNLHGNKKK